MTIRRELKYFLGLEGFAIIWAGAVFKIFADRWWAGIFAGVYFILSAAWMFSRAVRWPNFLRSFSFYPLVVHLFAISIPLMVERIWSRHVEFATASVWGIPGPVFHQLSTTVFSILIIGTLLDLYRTRRGGFGPPSREVTTNLG